MIEHGVFQDWDSLTSPVDEASLVICGADDKMIAVPTKDLLWVGVLQSHNRVPEAHLGIQSQALDFSARLERELRLDFVSQQKSDDRKKSLLSLQSTSAWTWLIFSLLWVVLSIGFQFHSDEILPPTNTCVANATTAPPHTTAPPPTSAQPQQQPDTTPPPLPPATTTPIPTHCTPNTGPLSRKGVPGDVVLVAASVILLLQLLALVPYSVGILLVWFRNSVISTAALCCCFCDDEIDTVRDEDDSLCWGTGSVWNAEEPHSLTRLELCCTRASRLPKSTVTAASRFISSHEHSQYTPFQIN